MTDVKRALRILECGMLFGVVPALLDLRAMGGRFIALMLLIMAVMLVLLWNDPSFDCAQLWRGPLDLGGKKSVWCAELRRIAGLWALGAISLAVPANSFTMCADEEKLSYMDSSQR